MTLLYYGVLRSWTELQSKDYCIGHSRDQQRNDEIALDAQNFTLKDQWGWKYDSKEYDIYGKKGISAMVLEPNRTIRSGLIFSSLSPLSRPVELVYQLFQ